ncbi:hypothetical protein [Peteryoungia ipomoeae]|uniref:Uncharacterized protein n=1 Tax=Peteryoungia ipomoeae TaxID=1210932 RepID=A0A4S8P527_9HYPH|nr:hypothetical protein [Peteryoungia ipomoeae]THV25247.1 hypothetical protein FAA97_03320 [Peteryoungia ipomoeae]
MMMRVGDNTIYSAFYKTPVRVNQEEQAARSSGPAAAGGSSSVEMDTSSKALNSSLWLLQTDVYYSKDAEKAALARNDLAAEFNDLANKSLAERLRDEYLEAHGLTEEEIAELPEEERMAVEQDIENFIKQRLGFEESGPLEGKMVAE